jgi:hypothetical protein
MDIWKFYTHIGNSRFSIYFKNISPLIFDPDDSVWKLFSKTVTYGLVRLKYFIQLILMDIWKFYILENTRFPDISKTFPR